MGFPGGAWWRIHLPMQMQERVGKVPWSRKWQSTPVFLPGKFHGQRSLAGYSSWGCRVWCDWAHISIIVTGQRILGESIAAIIESNLPETHLSEISCRQLNTSPLDGKEIKPVNTKGKQPWIFIGRTDDEAEAPILWQPDVKSWLIGKTLMLGKMEGRRRRGWQRVRWLAIITDSMNMSLHRLWDIQKDRGDRRAAESQTWLRD